MVFNDEFNSIVKKSRSLAIQYQSRFIFSYHFLLALECSNSITSEIIRTNNWNLKPIKKALIKDEAVGKLDKYFLLKEFERAIKYSSFYAWIYYEQEIKPEHVVFAMLADKNSLAGKHLRDIGITYDSFKKDYHNLYKTNTKSVFEALGKSSFLVRIGFPGFIKK
ncbi:Clp protease N-terminal domain-containing protein [uncultured Lacinutrix sp.]|uniref:Clp protease N-terminal domain-containing protein n=1 Tax=uncultured Lacinutrix sp. TaxID=574032 RepID=UPI002604BC5B|nr:Clp protease N-terminal domain-containing protein [uncultured Lacinutrix sp.]